MSLLRESPTLLAASGPSPISPLFPRPLLPAAVGQEPGSSEPLLADAELSGNLQTAFNIINNYVGMVLLSMSFAFVACGWLALPLLLVLSVFGCYTGALIVMSYVTVADAGELVPSYAKIGERACGAFGKWLVLLSSVVETFFAVVCMNVIMWENAVLMVPAFSPRLVVLGCILLSLPTNWLRNFSLLSFLSAFGLLCVILICLVVGYQAVQGVPSDMEVQHEIVRLQGVPMAASIVLAGLTGHVGLPPMYCSMRKPSAFYSTLALSFAAMTVMYGFVGACGYYLYGTRGSVLITADMTAAVRTVIDAVIVQLVLGGITFKIFCSVPMCIVVLTDIAENLYFERQGRSLSDSCVMRWRLGLWLGGVVCAVVMRSSLQYLTAFIGMNSLIISIILPIVFYFLLHREKMGVLEQIWFYVLLGLSAVVTVMISWVDIDDFIASLHAPPQRT